jgi:hypothetical protein
MSGGSAVQKLWDAWSATNVGPGNLLTFREHSLNGCYLARTTRLQSQWVILEASTRKSFMEAPF